MKCIKVQESRNLTCSPIGNANLRFAQAGALVGASPSAVCGGSVG